MHVSDWAPTLVLGAADIEPDVDTANFDGYNLWGAFNELNVRAWVVPPPRRRLLSLIFFSCYLVDLISNEYFSRATPLERRCY